MKVVESKLEAARARLGEAKTTRDFARDLLQSTETAIVGSEPVTVLTTRLTSADTDLANAKADVEHAMDDRDRKREALDDADASLRRAEGLLVSVSDRLRVIRTRWLAMIPTDWPPILAYAVKSVRPNSALYS